MKKPVIMWFRQDLRIDDNPALNHAAQMNCPILAIYILDDKNIDKWPIGAASRWWLHHSLEVLSNNLAHHDIKLHFFKGCAQEILLDLTAKTHAGSVCWNRLYEPFNIERDTKIKAQLKQQNIAVHSFQDSLLHEPWTIKNKSGAPFQVYTPFSKSCFAMADPPAAVKLEHSLTNADCENDLALSDLALLPKIKWDSGFHEYWQAGEDGASKKLHRFIDEALSTYKEKRDYPALPFTSKLSPHIHWGEISIRRVWNIVQSYIQAHPNNSVEKNATHFLKELLWREFAYHLLYHFPQLPTEPLNQKFQNFPWQENQEYLSCWQKGQTGYPIIDAAMRELWHTGWMHNRARMIVGSFLVKNLRLHWLHGEKWFWDCLVDADLANNAAGWQWIAGCGADAAPYFRIFNPILQGKKFDADGAYIRRWVPEIAALPDQFIHCPWEAPEHVLEKANVKLGQDYPPPSVDLKETRDAALAAFQSLKKEEQQI